MSIHFLIDGYNLIRSASWEAKGSLRDQREALLNFIESRLPQGSLANRVTVVFDGREDVSSPVWPGPTRVIFSHGKDADTLLKNHVDDLSHPRDAVVVTDDNAVRRWVRGSGARIMSCREFLAGAGGRSFAKKQRGLGEDEARDINEELKKIWKLK